MVKHDTIGPMSVKHFLCVLFLSTVALAQLPTQNVDPCITQQCFFTQFSGTVNSSASTTLTIQQPTTGVRQVTLIAAVVQCPGQSYTIAQAQNGTPAVTTAGTATALSPIFMINGGTTPVSASALIFTASNVGVGTATASTYTYLSGLPPQVITLSSRSMGTAPAQSNYSLTLANTGAGSCSAGIGLYWSEKI